LIDEEALRRAIEHGTVAAAALDVLKSNRLPIGRLQLRKSSPRHISHVY
jgi:phosphoglycerate dehydrogenase-like enzyme